jgi:hypothetical protein
MAMKRTVLLVGALLLLASALSAAATTQKWTAGWDNFGEPLNYKKSSIRWSVNPTTSKLSVTFTLVGATPSKLYEVGVDFVCTTFPATFGQFPVVGGGGTCQPATRQGVTENVAGVVFGVVTTDMNGNGSFTVVIGPVAAGTYVLEFIALNGAGCDLIGGGGTNADTCSADFQSPGPTFGDTTTITVP